MIKTKACYQFHQNSHCQTYTHSTCQYTPEARVRNSNPLGRAI